MSPAPGVNVTSGGSLNPSSPPVDIGQWFVAGLTEKGPINAPVLVRSLTEYRNTFGAAVVFGALYNSLDVFFREGGARAYVGRVVGPSQVSATVTLSDGTSNTLKVTALSPGEWGNALSIVTTHPGAGTFQFVVKLGEAVVQESPVLEVNAEAVAWASTSEYLRIEDLGGADPAVATKTLSGGTDDRTNITEAQWLAALNLFSKDLGPGQVSVPGHTTTTGWANALSVCESTNRIAILDATDTATIGTLTAAAATPRALSTARYGGLFAPWLIVPGVAVGTTRTVPPSCVVAGIMARNDGEGLNPNEPAAGTNGVSRYAVGVTQPAWSEPNRETLNLAGVNVLRSLYGSVRVYGFRTLVNTVIDATWEFLSNARLDAFIKAKCAQVGERFEFREIGRKVPAEFGSAIEGEVLLPLYNDEALFGETFADAAQVDIDATVNTPEKIAAGQLNAAIAVVESTFAETINIAITKEPV